MNHSSRAKAGAVVVALLMLAVMSSRASPGFPLAEVPKVVGRTIVKALGAKPARPAPPRPPAQRGASSYALSDISRPATWAAM